MAYTPFALLLSSIIVAMAFGSMQQVNSGIAPTDYSQSVATSWSDTQARYAIDSLSKYTNIYSPKKTKSEVNQALKSLVKYGTYNSNKEREYTYQNWTNRATKQSSKLNKTVIYNTSIKIRNLSIVTDSILEVQTKSTHFTYNTSNSKKIKDVKDPLLDDESYSRDINYCGFDSLAEKIYNSSEINESSGTIRGKAIIEPETLPSTSRNSKIIITSDITNYSDTETNEFGGYFSKLEPTDPGRFNNNYTVGINSMPDLKENQRVIIKNGLWKSNFYKAIPQNCYIPTDLKKAPTVYDRINESTRGDTNQGIFTVLNPKSSNSDIGYERKDNTSLNIVGIETISKNNAWKNYSMSESLANAENLTELIK